MSFATRMWEWRDAAGTRGSLRLQLGDDPRDPVAPYVWEVLWDRMAPTRVWIFEEINA